MRITDAKVIICSPGRNFVTLKLVTEDGVYGLGDATLNGRELAVASYLSDHVIPLLINRDARRIEDMWQYLYKGAYWRRGPVTMSAISAVDTALWDILGKTVNAPVYRLLGGASRDSVMVYGHANGSTPDETVHAVQEYLSMGYRAIRAQCAIPGVVNAYGVGRGTMYYEPAQKGMPLESVWSTERYLDFVPPLFERLRREVGFDVHLLHDVHHRLTPIEAARLGKSLEPYRLFWLEDPVPAENQAAFRTDPPSHDDADRGRRGLQRHPRLSAADRRGADRLHPHDRRPWRRHQPSAEDCRAGRTASRPNRIARRDRSGSGVAGGGAALRPQRPQLRHPGVHAAHAGDRRCVSSCLSIRKRRHASRRQAGAGRRHR